MEGDSVSTMVGPACQYTFAKPISSQACSLISKMPMLCMQAHKRRSECGSALIMSRDQFCFNSLSLFILIGMCSDYTPEKNLFKFRYVYQN